jgi:hypothetical protein
MAPVRRRSIEAMNTTSNRHPIIDFIADLGALRLMLGALGLLVIVFAPEPGVETQRSGLGLITTGVLPAMGPMVFMVLLLDAIMSRVLMIDKEGAVLRRYRRALWFNLGLAAAIILAWLPFILTLAA